MQTRPTTKAVILICASLLLGAPNVPVNVNIEKSQNVIVRLSVTNN